MEKIKELELELVKHKSLYYQGKAEISDEEYDKIEDELRKLDPNNSILDLVGTVVLSSDKIEHDKKMLSLNKTYKFEDLSAWANTEEVISTFKIDGSSCSLIYENEKLEIAKTRGDGRFGENILNKILCIENIPKKLRGYKSKVEIRGEVYCCEDNFLKLCEEMKNLNLETPTSKRNIVAGLLGRKENIELSRFLSFQAFELISDENNLKTEEEKFKLLESKKFKVPAYHLNRTEKDFKERLSEAKDFMANGDYLIDGMVFTYNNIALHSELGETAHHPRYKMAFKFQGETKFAKISSISWQVSRNGYLTPVANIEPVELSGAMVSRVTLHNYGMVKQFSLKKDDIIEVVRSGEVIPKFLSVKESSANKFSRPENCPSCDEIVREEDIRLICDNSLCPGKIKDEILNFIQKIGIDDLSGKRLDELIRAGFVTDIPSLYDLSEKKLLELDKVKDKLANKIITNIKGSKNADLITFLAALGISGGAYNKCEKIVKSGFDSLEKILSLTVEELCTVESFAEKSSTEFIKSINSKKAIIEKLVKSGFSFEKIKFSEETILAGFKFCITGSLSMKRSDLQKLIKENGGEAVSTVTKKTNFLITNDTESSSSKFKKAKELDIKILNETQFLEMIKK